MLARHLFLRRPPRTRVVSQILRPRLQHDQHGPHKEYFQHPSQYPSELKTGQSIAGNVSANFQQPTTFVPIVPEAQTVPPVPPRPSLIRRAIRVTLIVNLFLLLGVAVGTGVVTWDYLQPPFEPDSEDYNEIKEGIEEILESCSMSENLRENGWFEEPIIQKRSPVDGTAGRHFVEDTLNGVDGVMMKVFRHPTTHSTALVFFAGFGVEGWPDVVHGGTIMSMFAESYNQHMGPVMREEGLHDALRPATQNIRHHAFMKPMRPGEVYTIFNMTKGWGHAQDQETGECFVVNTTQSFLVSADVLPMIQVDNKAFPFDTPSLIRLESSMDTLHAAGIMHTWMTTDRVIRREEETNDQYKKRVSANVDDFLRKRFTLDDLERGKRGTDGFTRD